MTTRVLRFDDLSLLAILSSFTKTQRAVFAAACAERLVPTLSDNPSMPEFLAVTARTGLDLLWRCLEGDSVPVNALARARQEVVARIPHDDSGVESHWLATDVMASVCYAIESVTSDQSAPAMLAARAVYEVLDALVQATEHISPVDPNAEQSLLASPLIQRELIRQARDLQEIRAVDARTQHMMARDLRTRAQAEPALARE